MLVILPLFGTEPPVSIAFDRDAAFLSLHDQIDSILRVPREWAILWDDGIASVDDPFPHFDLEITIRRLSEDGKARFNFRFGWVEIPTEKFMPHAPGIIDVSQLNRMEKKDL